MQCVGDEHTVRMHKRTAFHSCVRSNEGYTIVAETAGASPVANLLPCWIQTEYQVLWIPANREFTCACILSTQRLTLFGTPGALSRECSPFNSDKTFEEPL